MPHRIPANKLAWLQTINPFIKNFIVSETMLWSGIYLVLPIIALFIANEVSNGNIEIAASGYSVYLISRVIFELFSGKKLENSTDQQKLTTTIIGITITGISFWGFFITSQVYQVFLFYSLMGIGDGLAAPAKYSIFSLHLDQNKETTEWSIYDSSALIGMAMASTIGGYIAMTWGFRILFFISAIVIWLSTVPYGYFVNRLNKKEN